MAKNRKGSNMESRQSRYEEENERLLQFAEKGESIVPIKDGNQPTRSSSEKMFGEQSAYFIVSEIWRAIIEDNAVKAVMDDYSVSPKAVNYIGLAIGISAYAKSKSKVAMSAVTPLNSEIAKEAFSESYSLFTEVLQRTGDYESAIQESSYQFFQSVTNFGKRSDLVPISAAETVNLLKGLSFRLGGRIGGKFVFDPVWSALLAVGESLLGFKKEGFIESMVIGFAKGVDSSMFNTTNFESILRSEFQHEEKSEVPVKAAAQAKEIGRVLSSASVKPSDKVENNGRVSSSSAIGDVAQQNTGIRKRNR
jgi:hypothetical protein